MSSWEERILQAKMKQLQELYASGNIPPALKDYLKRIGGIQNMTIENLKRYIEDTVGSVSEWYRKYGQYEGLERFMDNSATLKTSTFYPEFSKTEFSKEEVSPEIKKLQRRISELQRQINEARQRAQEYERRMKIENMPKHVLNMLYSSNPDRVKAARRYIDKARRKYMEAIHEMEELIKKDTAEILNYKRQIASIKSKLRTPVSKSKEENIASKVLSIFSPKPVYAAEQYQYTTAETYPSEYLNEGSKTEDNKTKYMLAISAFIILLALMFRK